MPTRLYKHGETVVLIGVGWPPCHRSSLWVVDWTGHTFGADWGNANVPVVRRTDPSCLVYAPRYLIEPAGVLDLLAYA